MLLGKSIVSCQVGCSFSHPFSYMILFLYPSLPGTLFSVQPAIANWLSGLFCMNERAVYTGEWQHGFFCMAPVGAVNVGSINVFFDHVSFRFDAISVNQSVCM